VELTAGIAYKIKIEFYKKLRYSFMQLIWQIPDDQIEQRAVAAAKKADVVVMVMGLSPRLEGEALNVELEGFKGGDRLKLDLPQTQSNFIRKIHKLGKPVVLVLLNGGPLSINWEDKYIPAIIEAWYPGQAAGTAIADVIFGDYNPGGKLPVTVYQSVEQLPAFTDYDMSNRTYRYFKGEPLYPFGHGLSYTTFSYMDLHLDKKEIRPDEQTLLSVAVSNTGKITGEEVVQLYIKAAKDNKTVKTLKGFKRISLMPNETRRVKFKITPERLARWIEGKGFSVEADTYTLMIGSSSSCHDLLKIDLKVKPK